MKKIKNLEAVAFSRYVRMSPFKLRRILDQIRGLSCKDALLILKFMPYKACGPILKVLNSAIANLKLKVNCENDFILVFEAKADVGPILKRIRPHAQGRGFPIKKRMSHITSCDLKINSVL